MSASNSRALTVLVFMALLLGTGVYFLGGPLKRTWAAMAFSEEQLREYEKLFVGPATGVDPGARVPPRTGKIVMVRPSTHFVCVTAGMTATLFWTQIDPSHRGKITGDVDPPRLDDAWFRLDPSLRADSPDEVETIVFCESAAMKDGIYVSEKHPDTDPTFDAHRLDQTIKVYDRRSGRLLGAKVVSGQKPPERTTALGKHRGELTPLEDVLQEMPLEASSTR